MASVAHTRMVFAAECARSNKHGKLVCVCVISRLAISETANLYGTRGTVVRAPVVLPVVLTPSGGQRASLARMEERGIEKGGYEIPKVHLLKMTMGICVLLLPPFFCLFVLALCSYPPLPTPHPSSFRRVAREAGRIAINLVYATSRVGATSAAVVRCVATVSFQNFMFVFAA